MSKTEHAAPLLADTLQEKTSRLVGGCQFTLEVPLDYLYRRGPFSFVEAVEQVSGFWAGINEVPESLRASESAG